jgi:hypothetical protein
MQNLTREQLLAIATDLDAENDALRLENERLLRQVQRHADFFPESAVPVRRVPVGEMCCGGTCVRAVCFIHGPQQIETP